MILYIVLRAGLEPARPKRAEDFKSALSTIPTSQHTLFRLAKVWKVKRYANILTFFSFLPDSHYLLRENFIDSPKS